MKRWLLTAFVVAITGCATWGQMKEGLDDLLDRPISTAIDRIGYPSSEQSIAGRKLYRWGSSSQSAMYMPSTTTTTGSIGTGMGYRPFSATTTGGSYIPVSYNCEIVLEVDSNDIIKRYQYNGNLGGCRQYIQALRK
jgi:hypothetical protein